MFKTILSMQKQKRFIIQGIITFIIFLVLYFVLDHLNMSYPDMIKEYGLFLVITNIFLNVFMSALSAFLWNISTGLVMLTGKEGKGSFVSGFAYLFGLLTYGCTPCVIALFSIIGITFSVAILPLAGLPYKFLALVLLVVGLAWLIYEANHVKCKIKKDQ